MEQVALFFKVGLEFFDCDVVGGLQRPHRGSEDFGNVLVGEVLEVLHREDQPLLLGEPCHSFHQFLLQCVTVEGRVILYAVLDLRGQAPELQGGPDLLFVEVVQGFVGGDPVEPGVEA